jgi:hypothetical protein
MDDYYEEPQPIPTFSDGSSSTRGGNSRANASRASASKSANSAASRASANMVATLRQIPKGSIMTSTGIRNMNQAAPVVNKSAILAAKRRTDIMVSTIKPPVTPIVKLSPTVYKIHIVDDIPKSTVILKQDNTKEPVNLKHTSEILKTSQLNAHQKKQELLIDLPVYKQSVKPQYNSIQSIQHTTPVRDIPLDKQQLQALCSKLSQVSTQSSVFDEFTNYHIRVRMNVEQELHRQAVHFALMNKKKYLNSDA